MTRLAVAAGEKVAFELSYELVRGKLAHYSQADLGAQPPYTAVLLHGIMGSRRNLLSFARRLADENPAWQFLLVDLRCHGASAASQAPGDNTLGAAALDVLSLLQTLRLFPHCLIGHSFGGKVAMAMVHVFGRRLPRPVQVWVLDTVPGDVYADGGDHPRDVIACVQALTMPIESRKALVDVLVQAGFTSAGAQWMVRAVSAHPRALTSTARVPLADDQPGTFS
jgi:pimeloyl-ACP methyl ester carboxylesterase